MPINQVATLSVPEAGADRRATVRSVGDGAIEKAIRASDLGLNPAERRQGRAHPDTGPHRGTAQGTVTPRPQAG
jgi:hypothetical protein